MSLWELFSHRGGPVYGRFCRVHLQRPVGLRAVRPLSCPDRRGFGSAASGADAPAGLAAGQPLSSTHHQVDHWIAFVLLCAIGGNMVRESRTCGACREMDASFCPQGYASPWPWPPASTPWPSESPSHSFRWTSCPQYASSGRSPLCFPPRVSRWKRFRHPVSVQGPNFRRRGADRDGDQDSAGALGRARLRGERET